MISVKTPVNIKSKNAEITWFLPEIPDDFNSWKQRILMIQIPRVPELTTVFESPWLFSPQDPVEDPSVDHATIQAKVVMERRPYVSDWMQLLPHPRLLQVISILRYVEPCSHEKRTSLNTQHSTSKILFATCSRCTCCLWVWVLCRDSGENGLGSQHATLHSCVGAFDLWDIHKTGAAANQYSSRERQFRDGLERCMKKMTANPTFRHLTFCYWL